MLQRLRRKKLRATPLKEAQREALRRAVPLYKQLSAEDRAELEGHVQVLLAEKRFEGAGGFEITEEIQLSVAGQAAVLLLHREPDYYPRLKSIVIYPGAYRTTTRRALGERLVVETEESRLGESWHHGTLVLAWDAVAEGGRDPDDGHNVVFHEFAHQLDTQSGAADGAPELPWSRYAAWARVLGDEYQQLQADLERHRSTFLRAYGAVSPAEFFAVVTEVFFERPRALKGHNPELYQQLSDFYRQDPAGWG